MKPSAIVVDSKTERSHPSCEKCRKARVGSHSSMTGSCRIASFRSPLASLTITARPPLTSDLVRIDRSMSFNRAGVQSDASISSVENSSAGSAAISRAIVVLPVPDCPAIQNARPPIPPPGDCANRGFERKTRRVREFVSGWFSVCSGLVSALLRTLAKRTIWTFRQFYTLNLSMLPRESRTGESAQNVPFETSVNHQSAFQYTS